jgi:hypothetical protein
MEIMLYFKLIFLSTRLIVKKGPKGPFFSLIHRQSLIHRRRLALGFGTKCRRLDMGQERKQKQLMLLLRLMQIMFSFYDPLKGLVCFLFIHSNKK